MKNEKPILYNAEMVKALLEGRKTQTRRPIKFPCGPSVECDGTDPFWPMQADEYGDHQPLPCPYGKVGDRLGAIEDSEYIRKFRHCMPEVFAEEWRCHVFQWDEIVSIRVERVQEISEADSFSEGVTIAECDKNLEPTVIGDFVSGAGRIAFNCLWNSVYTDRQRDWFANPWVWVVEFRVMEAGVK